jgi:hypothetical protein
MNIRWPSVFNENISKKFYYNKVNMVLVQSAFFGNQIQGLWFRTSFMLAQGYFAFYKKKKANLSFYIFYCFEVNLLQ